MPVERATRKPSAGSSIKPTKPNPIKTDVIISIKSPHIDNIVSRVKNHEFRKYLIPNTVERMYMRRFYVSSPDQTLRYVATISKGKSRGEVADKKGLGNAEFNSGLKESKYAYEILQLHKLRTPLPNVEMKKEYGLATPQRYTYVPEKLFEEVELEDQEELF